MFPAVTTYPAKACIDWLTAPLPDGSWKRNTSCTCRSSETRFSGDRKNLTCDSGKSSESSSIATPYISAAARAGSPAPA